MPRNVGVSTKPSGRVKAASGRETPRPLAPDIAVDPEERRRLAECFAFFKVERFRRAEPGKIRQSDINAAEAELDAIITNTRNNARNQ
jgi:hypothetical protein